MSNIQKVVHPKNQRKGGPKTKKGKKKVRYNAAKHGILSKAAILPSEKKQDYIQLLSSLLESIQPKNTIEEMLIEKLAICHWRLARVYRFEESIMASELEKENRMNSNLAKMEQLTIEAKKDLEFAHENLEKLEELRDQNNIDETFVDFEHYWQEIHHQISESPFQSPAETKKELIRLGKFPIACQCLISLQMRDLEKIENEIEYIQVQIENTNEIKRLIKIPSELEKLTKYEGVILKQFNQTLEQIEKIRATGFFL